ncbi:two-component sensor histidine kinase [Zhengella mangrovi]|uniref:histidine kinase n=1 Tax=Zhengella mangrovi TaxID=1982044 RepID=A0A2G1QTA9_9HYPH|nr:ActS/PrrB/RegB family redox-sensitive histidine kinase [Zhengella mangrovi]PHP68699.1 two-component sensor histidine kinase [Zhengella mangrovi]
METVATPDPVTARRLRLNTLIRLRWLAVTGQTIAVVVVHFWLDFPFPILLCLALIACSAWLNIFLAFRYPPTFRLSESASLGVLAFDALQLAGLLYMTGGMTNPFSMLLMVPVIISAASLPVRHTLMLGLLVLAAASLLAVLHLPLPWLDGRDLPLPFLYVAGMWMALVSSLAFTGIYAFRVADEARTLATALASAELVLQREQHLSALDGLAAAAAHELGTPLATIALVAREMERDLPDDSPLREDVGLLRSQSQRCRDILRRLTSLSSEGEMHIGRLPLSSLVDEVVAPHREFGIEIRLLPEPGDGPEPVLKRNPGMMYGLGNLLENGVDFANASVSIAWGWTVDEIWIEITDDGRGYSPEILARIGEPYTTSRAGSEQSSGGGLGLGLFIAKTLLERSGATLSFSNAWRDRLGARVRARWSRDTIEAPVDLAQGNDLINPA